MELHPVVFSANPRIDLIHETVKWQDQCVREDEIAYMRSELPGSGRKLRPQKVGFNFHTFVVVSHDDDWS